MKFRTLISGLAVLSAALLPRTAAFANTTYKVTIPTGILFTQPLAGPFSLDFQLTDGSGGFPADGNNTVTFSQFSFGPGGGATPGTISLLGGAVGSLDNKVTLTDSEFASEFTQAFTPGQSSTGELSFVVDMTTHTLEGGLAPGDDGYQPDEIAISILDGSGFATSTQDSAASALVVFDLNAWKPVPLIFNGTEAYADTADILGLDPIVTGVPQPPSVPEASSLSFVAAGIGAALLNARRLRLRARQ